MRIYKSGNALRLKTTLELKSILSANCNPSFNNELRIAVLACRLNPTRACSCQTVLALYACQRRSCVVEVQRCLAHFKVFLVHSLILIINIKTTNNLEVKFYDLNLKCFINFSSN
jgi:hypothetical protein